MLRGGGVVHSLARAWARGREAQLACVRGHLSAGPRRPPLAGMSLPPRHPGPSPRLRARCSPSVAGASKAVVLRHRRAQQEAVLVRHPECVLLTDLLMALADVGGAGGFDSAVLGRFVRTHVHGVASDAVSEDFVMV